MATVSIDALYLSQYLSIFNFISFDIESSYDHKIRYYENKIYDEIYQDYRIKRIICNLNKLYR